jgi:tetratricopeptide (TPR) repeat protein
MSDREELDRAVGELQAFARQVPPEAHATRARILAGERGRSRGTLKWWLAALGLLAIGGPALAQVTGVLPQLVEQIAGLFGPALEPPRETARRPQPAPRVAESAPQTPVVESLPSAEDALPAARPRELKPNRTRRAASDEHKVDAARALYLEAHRAHFEGGEPKAALQAWDAFLRAAPSDAFAPEARYNRAILLVKLARYAEAQRALEPFACAASGAYRQLEARALAARVRALAPELPALPCGEQP